MQFNKRIAVASAVALIATMAGCASEPMMSPSGMMSCAKGGNGDGGIYRPGAAYCEDGAIIPSDMKLCRKGKNGDGGIYRPGMAACDAGRIY